MGIRLPLLIGLLMLALAGCGGSRPRDVLLVVVDTLRADHLGAYGAAPSPSPHIDRLAAEGIRYDRAIAQAPWTTPSIASLLTSRYPTVLGIRREAVAIPGAARLLSEILREHGLATGAVVSNDYCSSRLNFDQGFDRFDDGAIVDPDQASSPEVTRRGLAFIDAHADRPFFLLLHYFDPHFDYLAHPGYGPTPADATPSRIGFLEVSRRFERGDLDAAFLGDVRRHYDSEIAYTDHYLGQVFAHLREIGLWDDTLVVFTADHGEEFMDHGQMGHGRALFSEVVRVPLIVKWPRGPVGVVTDTVALLDVVPTVLDGLGLALPDDLDGEVLLRPGQAARSGRVVFSETARPRGKLRRAAVGVRYALVEGAGAKRRPALFDLEADPGERRDLADARGEPRRMLAGALAAWSAALRPIGGAMPVELTPAERRRLRKLGYLRD